MSSKEKKAKPGSHDIHKSTFWCVLFELFAATEPTNNSEMNFSKEEAKPHDAEESRYDELAQLHAETPQLHGLDEIQNIATFAEDMVNINERDRQHSLHVHENHSEMSQKTNYLDHVGEKGSNEEDSKPTDTTEEEDEI